MHGEGAATRGPDVGPALGAAGEQRLDRRRFPWQAYAFLSPALIATSIVFAASMVILLVYSFRAFTEGRMLSTFSTATWTDLLTSGFFWHVVWTTMKLGLITVALTIAIGYPMALALYRLQSRTLRYVAYFLLFAPLLTSVVVRSYGWALILGDGGFLNDLLLRWGVIDRPIRMLYEFSGVTIGLVHILLPFMIFPILAVLDQFDPMLEQAAADLGATGATIVPTRALPAHGAGRDRRRAARVRARDQRVRDADTARRRPRAGARGEDLQRRRRARLAARRRRLVRSAHAGARCDRDLQRAPAAAVRHDEGELGVRAVNGARFRPGRIALYLFLVAGLVFMVAPIAIVVVESFNSSAFGQWPPPGFSTMWYGRLFHGGGFGEPTIRSLELGLAATALSLVAGTLAGLAIARYRFAGRRAAQGFVAAPLIVPKVAIGIAAFVLFLKLGWYGSFGSLILVHIVLTLPFVVTLAVAGFARVDHTLEEAAADLGARPRQVLLARDAAADAGDARRRRGVQLHHQLRRAGRVDLPRRSDVEHAADGDVHLHAEVPGSDAGGALVAADRRVAARGRRDRGADRRGSAACARSAAAGRARPPPALEEGV